MSVSFSSKIPTLVFSSQLPEKTEVTTTLTRVVFSVVYEGETLITLSLDTYDGKAYLYDIRSIIEQHMLDKGLSMGYYTIIAGVTDGIDQAKLEICVIYCGSLTSLDTTEFLQSNFLSSLQVRRTHHSVIERLTFVSSAGESSEIKASVVMRNMDPDGAATIIKQKIQIGAISDSSPAVHFINVSFDELLQKTSGGDSGTRILAVSVTAGSRSATFYYTEDSPSTDLVFRNVFNAMEHCPVWGVTRRKMLSDKSEAVSGGIMSFYDELRNMDKEIQTCPLLPDTAVWMSGICLSHEVYECPWEITDVSGMRRVLITDHTAEIDDDGEELPTLKFTYQYPDHRPSLPVNNPEPRIFTREFEVPFT